MTTDVLPVLHISNPTAVPALAREPRPAQTEKQASESAPRAKPVQQALAAVAKQIESYLRSVGRSLEFQVDETTGETIVTVRDAESGEVIRQIPGEETLRLARSLGNQPNALVDLIA
jgi:flagellar protein FlaG